MQVPTSCRGGVYDRMANANIMICLVLWGNMMAGAINSAPPAPKLLDLVRDRLRLKHCSIRTETQYLQWIRRFVLFHCKRHPKEMGVAEVQ